MSNFLRYSRLEIQYIDENQNETYYTVYPVINPDDNKIYYRAENTASGEIVVYGTSKDHILEALDIFLNPHIF